MSVDVKCLTIHVFEMTKSKGEMSFSPVAYPSLSFQANNVKKTSHLCHPSILFLSFPFPPFK